MKILHVEDNHEFREHIKNVILSGHEITGADDGSEGIRLFDEFEFDVVLLDYQMIEVHGPEVIKHIRAKGSKIPVIATSMEDRFNRELLELGATVAIPKRDMELLPEAIKNLY